MYLSDLQNKEVIDISSGKRIGTIIDIIITLNGTIQNLVLEDKKNGRKFLTNNNIKKINIVIGPEGGISPKEEEYLNSIGFTSISLGENIMRVETVPMFILSVLNYENM